MTRAVSFRVATQHHAFCTALRDMLRPVVEAHSPHRQWATGSLSPPHWQWTCSAEFLLRKVESRATYFGALGIPVPRAETQSPVAQRERRAESAACLMLADPRTAVAGRLQARLTQRIQECVLPFDGKSLIARRAMELTGMPPLLAVIDNALSRVRRLKGTSSAQVWRAWLGGFTTTRRFHSVTRLRCVFGCLREDDQKHYLECPRLWLAIARTTAPPMPGPEPIARLALTLCDDAVGTHRLRQLATATAVYQAFACDQQLRLISQRAHASRDLRLLGKSILSVACDRALVHGGREFMRVPQELRGA